jgi:hypothetical protein
MSTAGPEPLPPIPMPAWMGAATRPVEREGPGGGGRDGSRPGPRLTLKAIKDYLRQSALGREAVAYFEEQNLQIDLKSLKGCAWDGTFVIIDRNYSVPKAALSFVHEVYHARADKGGTTGDRHVQSRDEYLHTMFDEEVHATIAAIKVRLELNEAGARVELAPRESEYFKGRRDAKKKLLAASPGASAEEQEAAAEQGGYDALMALYVSGQAKGSRDGRPYTEIYGDAWDRAHAPRA